MVDESRQTGAYQVQVNKQTKGTKNDLVSMRSMNGERYAMKVLSPSALKIYLYVTGNENNWHFLLYSKKVQEDLGIARRTFTSAIADLIDNGFLVKRTDGSGEWIFYDNPPVKDEMKITLIKENG